MTTQRLTGLAAAVAAVTLAAPGTGRADHQAKHFEDCAKVCADCLVVCEKTFHHCLTMVAAGKKERAKAMHLSADRAEFCAVSAKPTARKSELAVPACEACDACAAECGKFPDVPEMKACAEACKKCAASCREMAKMVGRDYEKK